MGLLSTKEREKQLAYLGFKSDKNGIKKFQKESGQTVDGIYGQNTDNALRTFYNVYKYTKNFKPTEFKCNCGKCKGYPTYMRRVTLQNIQTIRTHYGKPITVTCGLRCKEGNKITGAISTSRHLLGQAVDFYQKGVTDTLANRKNSIKYIASLPNAYYTYGNGVGYNAQSKVSTKPNAPNMGNALHMDTLKKKQVIKIAHAVRDENGNLKGGKKGDQTGKEVLVQELTRTFEYIARRSDVSSKLVKAMVEIANNENVGYAQDTRLTLYEEAKKVGFVCSKIKNKCNTDCSAMVRTALKVAGVDVPSSFRTKNMKENLEKVGFEIIKFDKNKLKSGDILFTPANHTAVVVEA